MMMANFSSILITLIVFQQFLMHSLSMKTMNIILNLYYVIIRINKVMKNIQIWQVTSRTNHDFPVQQSHPINNIIILLLQLVDNTMFKLAIMKFLLIHIVLAIPDYRTFTDSIQTGVINIININSSFASNDTFAVTFNSVTSAPNYKFIFAIASLIQHNSGNATDPTRYGAMANFYERVSTTSMRFTVRYWTPTITMTQLKFRYCILDPSFPYFDVKSHYEYHNTEISYGSNPINSSVALTGFNTSPTDVVIPFLGGFDIGLVFNPGTYTVDYLVSFEVDTEYESATSVRVLFRGNQTVSTRNTLRRFLVYLLFYHKPQLMSVFNNQTFIYFTANEQFTPTSPSKIVYQLTPPSNVPINEVYLFGLNSYTDVGASSQLYFDTQRVGNDFQMRARSQTFNSSFIIFLTVPHCLNSVWNASLNQCQECPSDQYFSTNSSTCVDCNLTHNINCISCTQPQCLLCAYPYSLINNSCVLECTSTCSSCLLSSISPIGYECTGCVSSGYYVQNYRECNSRCGDGINVLQSEECDDGNTDDRDGCSSLCQIQTDFNCTGPPFGLSVCSLTRLEFIPVAVVKTQDANSFTFTLQVEPANVRFYPQSDWQSVFANQTSDIRLQEATFDAEYGWLRLTFSYKTDIHGNNITIAADSSVAGVQFANLSASFVKLSSEVQNNLKLVVYQDSSYSIASIVKYCSYAVAVLALLLFFLGYFGAKIIAIQCTAIVQLAALLLITLEDIGPTFFALKPLSLSLGITPLTGKYRYESSSLPAHAKPLISDTDCFSSFNIFFMVILGPLLTGTILAILSATIFKENKSVQKAWKYAFGTFTHYGLLFLAYGVLTSFALSFKPFQLSSSLFSIAVGCIFLISLIISTVVMNKYLKIYGSFKSKFYRFQAGQYFYTFVSLQRLLTVCFIVFLSPGPLSSGLPILIFLAQTLFILIKKPYIESKWKRPLVNKLLSIVLCSCYLAASFMNTRNQIYEFIPFAIMLILIAVLVYSTIIAIKQVYEDCKQKKQQKQKRQLNSNKDNKCNMTGDELTFQESQKALMLQFQKKMMPVDFPMSSSRWKPVQHENVDLNKWRWSNYPKLYSLDPPRQHKQHKQHEQGKDIVKLKYMEKNVDEERQVREEIDIDKIYDEI